MTVKQLREAIKDVPDNIDIFINQVNDEHAFNLAEAGQVHEVRFQDGEDGDVAYDYVFAITDEDFAGVKVGDVYVLEKENGHHVFTGARFVSLYTEDAFDKHHQVAAYVGKIKDWPVEITNPERFAALINS